MKITPPVLSALKKAVDQAGNPTRFSKETGIRQTTIRNWLLGITKSISTENWEKIAIYLDISASNLEIMHRDIDQIGPDTNLMLLLGIWKNMPADLRKRLQAIIDEAVARDVIPDMFDFVGLNLLPEEEKNRFLDKYGGLEKLKILCSVGAIDDEEIYQEIENLVKKHPEIETEMDKFNKDHPHPERE